MTTTTRPAATGHPRYSETHPCTEGMPTAVRGLVRAALTTWGMTGGVIGDAEQIISELATNAVRHAPCRTVRVTVARLTPARVRLAVVDRAPARLPHLQAPDTSAETGRGLVLIDSLADRWGYDLLGSHPQRGPWGNRCWAEILIGDAR